MTTLATRSFQALIVGAGFAGLYQLHCLRDRWGFSVLVLEAGAGVGGTWYWNRYPGARCDSESHGYCFTFFKELFEQWEWTERYPAQPEILRYLNYVADRLDLKRDIRFNTRVTAVRYEEAANLWHVTIENGTELAATYLITAVGCLSTANVPNIPGCSNFRGQWVHTGRWPHEGVDLRGKRVGVIGTGSTAIQAIPVIAETAGHLTVFQRTANYSVPARNAPLSAPFQKYVKDNHATIWRATRSTQNGQPFPVEERAAFDVTPEERQKLYEAAWEKGGLQFRATFRDLLTNKAANDTASAFIKSKIRAIVTDAATANKLADIDHPYAAKRPPIDTNYFETCNCKNVSLVDVRAAPIEAITPTGLRTRDGKEYALDIIVFATGFDVMTGPLLRLNIAGRDGLTLAEAWSAGPRNYLGLQVVGFPNLFMITGPGSPSVLTNMPVAIEQHAKWITDCIAHMRQHGFSRIEPRPEAVDRWVQTVNEAANAILLPMAHHSSYVGSNVPGKPRVFMPYAGGMLRYRELCGEVTRKGYEGFALSR